MSTAQMVVGGISIGASLLGIGSDRKAAAYNEKQARLEAEYQKAKTETEVNRHWKRVDKLMSEQRALYSKSGVALSSGSVQDVQSETLSEAEMDAAIIKLGGDAAVGSALAAAKQAKLQQTASTISGVARIGQTVLMSGAFSG